MIANTNELSVLQVTEQGGSKVDSRVVREFSLKIVLNGEELVTLLCSPTNLQYLAVGFVQSLGLIKTKGDIKSIVVDDGGTARIETKEIVDVSPKSFLTSSGGKSAGFVNMQKEKAKSQIRLSADQVFSFMEDFEQRSKTFKATGGVHSAALCDARKGILVFSEDIGRHNAIDRMFGQCLMQDIKTDDCLVLTTGRVSSEIVFKVAARGMPVLIARNAPTDVGIKVAEDFGITLIGFVRGKSMTVYVNDWRLANCQETETHDQS